ENGWHHYRSPVYGGLSLVVRGAHLRDLSCPCGHRPGDTKWRMAHYSHHGEPPDKAETPWRLLRRDRSGHFHPVFDRTRDACVYHTHHCRRDCGGRVSTASKSGPLG